MKIVITDGFAVNPGDLSWDIFKQFGQVEIYKDTPNTLAAQRIGDADIAIINKTVIDEQLLQQCPNLKLICVAATGYNVVDCAATKKRGIPVCNVPGYGTAAVAQFTFSLLLELCNRVGHHDLLVHEGEWGQRGGFCFWDTPQTELAGKTMGIIGYGTIGQAVGKIAEAFGMHVLAFNRSHTVKGADYVSLEELLQKSDIISLHCPYTPETHQIINSRTIAQMKEIQRFPVIINALNTVNNIDVFISIFNIINKLNNINKLQTKHLYQFLKCNVLPKKHLLTINDNITKAILFKGNPNSIPLNTIRAVSAALKMTVEMILLIFVLLSISFLLCILI